MCESCAAPELAAGELSAASDRQDRSSRPGLSRRAVVRGLGAGVPAAVFALVLGESPPAAAVARLRSVGPEAPQIVPRAAWGGDLPVVGPLEAEASGDVRFLLVHHTASSNNYAPSDTFDQLRSFYRLHTGPDKGWPDIAYNFLIDRFGVIHEGRAGSIDRPVMGSATGGSQGFAQLCCFIGDHSSEAPTDEAQVSMVSLLAWLAGRYGVPMSPGSSATFVSRGSNRWPAGQTVTTPTIAGHRDMSSTACPGDAAYALLDVRFRPEVASLVADTALAEPPTTAPSVLAAGEPVAPLPTEPARSTPSPTSTSTSTPPTTAAATQLAPTATDAPRNELAADTSEGDDSSTRFVIGGSVVLGAAVAATAAVLRRRSVDSEEANQVESSNSDDADDATTSAPAP